MLPIGNKNASFPHSSEIAFFACEKRVSEGKVFVGDFRSSVEIKSCLSPIPIPSSSSSSPSLAPLLFLYIIFVLLLYY
jgi:hypothetical protein